MGSEQPALVEGVLPPQGLGWDELQGPSQHKPFNDFKIQAPLGLTLPPNPQLNVQGGHSQETKLRIFMTKAVRKGLLNTFT